MFLVLMPTSPKHNTTNTNLNFLWDFGNKERVGGVYEYSFQAQEHDDEIKGPGNSINYKYRMHDTRLGRFFAVDPLSAKYPWNSPYAFSENRVIDGIELEGLEYQSTGKEDTNWEDCPDCDGSPHKNDGADDIPTNVQELPADNLTYNVELPVFEVASTKDQPTTNIDQPTTNDEKKLENKNLYINSTFFRSQIQPAYLFAEGVGVNGTYKIKTGFSISYFKGKTILNISATGTTSAKYAGDIDFFGNATLLVNGTKQFTTKLTKSPFGHIIQSGYYEIGGASIVLPNHGDIKVQINSGYTLFTNDGPIVPYPYTTTITVPIPKYNDNHNQTLIQQFKFKY